MEDNQSVTASVQADSLTKVAKIDEIGWQYGLKRILGFLIATLLIVILSPLLLAVAMMIKFDSTGPVIYKRRCVGRFGNEFNMLKFRTMVQDSDLVLESMLAQNPIVKQEYLENFKLIEDPRITRFGQFLRKTSIDELPQLFNVIRGEMCLIGPRPKAVDEIDKFGIYADFVLSVHPGLSGAWQVNGRSEVSYAERIQIEVDYVKNWTLSKDIIYFFKTIITVLKKTGAR